MDRRQLLKSIAASVVQLSILRRVPAAALTTKVTNRRFRPTDPEWPRASSWETLKKAVGGNLVEVRSLFGACPANPKDPACVEAMDQMRNPFYIGDQTGGTQVSGWLNAWTPSPSVYAITAKNAGDVAAAVNFARKHNLRPYIISHFSFGI